MVWMQKSGKYADTLFLDIVESKIETKRTAKSFKDIFNQPVKVGFYLHFKRKEVFKCLIL